MHNNLTKIYEKQAITRSKPIIQYDLNNNYIKSWQSAHDAERELGLKSSNILLCCKRKNEISRLISMEI